MKDDRQEGLTGTSEADQFSTQGVYPDQSHDAAPSQAHQLGLIEATILPFMKDHFTRR
ncbi:hypothetical protein ACI2KR_24995 [Pseudomonas luteola]